MKLGDNGRLRLDTDKNCWHLNTVRTEERCLLCANSPNLRDVMFKCGNLAEYGTVMNTGARGTGHVQVWQCDTVCRSFVEG